MARFYDGESEVDVASKRKLFVDFSFAADSSSLAWSKMRVVDEAECREAFETADEFESGELGAEETKALLLALLIEPSVVEDIFPSYESAAEFTDGSVSWELFWECTSAYVERAAAVLAEEDAIREGGVQWLRPDEMAVREEPFLFSESPCQIVPGHIGDSYFLGAMACVAAHPNGIIENLFDENADDFLETGQITVSFFRGSDWIDVVIDTRIPCDAHGRPLYASAANPAEMWVAFVEKAYAKLHGGYSAIAVRGDAGSSPEASDRVKNTLVELCGGVGFSVLLGDPRVRAMLTDGNPCDLWRRVGSWLSRGYVVGCSRVPSMPGATPDAGIDADGIDDGDSVSSGSESGGESDDEDGGRPSTAALAAEQANGLADGALYTVLRANEVGGLLFLHVRNPWGVDANWKGEWSADSDAWDENPHIVSAMEADSNFELNRTGEDDGTFWIVWQDFISAFNVIDVCSIFGPTFHQYIAQGEWRGKSASGMYRAVGGGGDFDAAAATLSLAATKKAGAADVTLTPNGDEAWCNNPQYRISSATSATVLVSLMQTHPRGGALHRTNFVVVRRGRSDRARCWQLDHRAIVADATSAEFSSDGASREVSRAGIEIDPAYSYIIVPHTHARGAEARFVLRLFSQQALTVEPLAETFTQELSGEWADRGNGSFVGDSTGGPLQLNRGTKTHPRMRLNTKWSQNPQYWLRCLGEVAENTTFQIVLSRVTEGGVRSATPSAQSSRNGTPRGTPDGTPAGSPIPGATPKDRLHKKKGAMVGIVVCKPNLTSTAAAARGRHGGSSSDRAASPRGKSRRGKSASPRASRSRGGGAAATKTGGVLDLDAAAEALPAVTDSIERKRELAAGEWAIQSMFESHHVSTMKIGPLSADFLRDGLLLTPSFDKADEASSYTLAVHSDAPIAIDELPSQQMQTIAGEWTDKTARGSHLKKDWSKNPRYALQLKGSGARVGDVARVHIAVHRPLSSWRQRGTASVDCMLGFYVIRQPSSQKGLRMDSTALTIPSPSEDGGSHGSSTASKTSATAPRAASALPFQTRFVPMNEVATPESFALEVLGEDEQYVIVPCTFEEDLVGPFFLSVTSPDSGFVLEQKGGKAKKSKKSSGGADTPSSPSARTPSNR